VASGAVSDQDLVEMMTGRQIGMLFPRIDHSPGEVILEVENLSVSGRLKDINLYLRQGEVAGLAGLAGGGKSRIIRTIFGLEQIESGRVVLRGRTVDSPSPARMLSQGVFYVPADRMAEGLALPRPVRENVSAAALDLPTFSAWGLLKKGRERSRVRQMTDQLNLRPKNIELPIQFLSGGNQQKAMLLRGLTRFSDVFLFDDPTVGIDVGAKKEFYLFLKQLTEQGAGVLLVSSELPELLNLSNRLYVAHQGRVVAEYSGQEINERNVLNSFFQVDRGSVATMDQPPKDGQ
jgi:ribose transport system ATP-binding protein